jgi:hypothetical protein
VCALVWNLLFGTSRPNRITPSHSVPLFAGLRSEPGQLLERCQERIKGLRLESGYQADRFNDLIMGPLLRVAEYVHDLPATHGQNHGEPGGLLRLAVETGCIAYRRADGKFLSGPVPTDVRHRERDRAWRYAAFLGGLLRPLGRCITTVQVVACANSAAWNPFLEPLWGWRQRCAPAGIQLHWRGGTDSRPERAAAVWVACRALSVRAVDHLHCADETLPQRLIGILCGDGGGKLCEIVDGSLQAATDQDLAQARHGTSGANGMSLEHRLLEAMRTLTREKWTVNTPGGRIWFTADGVFLAWKAAANDIAIRLRGEGVAGPQDPDTIAELLVAHNVLAVNPHGTSALKHHFRLIPHLRGVPKQPIEVVKLVDAEQVGVRIESIDAIEAEMLIGNDRAASASSIRAELRSLPLPFESPRPNVGGATGPSSPASQRAVREPEVTAEPAPSAGGPEVSVPERPAAEPVAGADPAIRAVPADARRRQGTSSNGESLKRLDRFGEAGRLLRKLAEGLSAEPQRLRTLMPDGGWAIAFPEAVEPFCEPQAFLAACESQGLLVPDKNGAGRIVRMPKESDGTLPRQYVVLSPRVAKVMHSVMEAARAE